MTLETEAIIDRRRLRRQLSAWRIAGILGLALAAGVSAIGGDRLAELTSQHQIARIAIEGTIGESRDQLKLIKKAADAKHVDAVLVYVNSPGGTTTGGEALYEALREVSRKKPVVAQFGTVAASAGYIVGLGADHIVARGNTITGSVGVIFQWPEVAGLLDRIGVKMNEVKSGPLKAAPSPFQPLTEDARKVTQEMVADSQRWFLSLVETRRALNPADIAGLKEGRIFSGRDALTHKLVDEIGGEEAAVKWLVDKKNVAKDTKVIDWKPKKDSEWGALSVASQIAGGILGGSGGEAMSALARNGSIGTLGLDGLVSVWQPSEN